MLKNKLLLIFVFIILANNVFSQEVKAKYTFYNSELILYKDSTFTYTMPAMLGYLKSLGTWDIKENQLILNSFDTTGYTVMLHPTVNPEKLILDIKHEDFHLYLDNYTLYIVYRKRIVKYKLKKKHHFEFKSKDIVGFYFETNGWQLPFICVSYPYKYSYSITIMKSGYFFNNEIWEIRDSAVIAPKSSILQGQTYKQVQ